VDVTARVAEVVKRSGVANGSRGLHHSHHDGLFLNEHEAAGG